MKQLYDVHLLVEEVQMARPTIEDEPMTERLILPIGDELSEQIKEYWHEQRLNSKSEAVRQLIRTGLEQWRKGKKA
jgi:hypothetical protein